MRTSAIVEVEIAPDRLPRLANAVVGPQIYLLVFDAAPQPFNKHIISPSPFTVHADRDVSDVSAYGTNQRDCIREDFWFIVMTRRGMKMNQKSQTRQTGAAKAIKDIRRATRKQYSAEEKIRIVLDGLRGEETIAELCRREGIAQSIYYKWSKEFLEAGKRRLAGDTARAASTGEVTALRREARELKEVVAEQTLELRLLKKSMIADGGDDE